MLVMMSSEQEAGQGVEVAPEVVQVEVVVPAEVVQAVAKGQG